MWNWEKTERPPPSVSTSLLTLLTQTWEGPLLCTPPPSLTTSPSARRPMPRAGTGAGTSLCPLQEEHRQHQRGSHKLVSHSRGGHGAASLVEVRREVRAIHFPLATQHSPRGCEQGMGEADQSSSFFTVTAQPRSPHWGN